VDAKLPGYIGNSVANRGREIDHASLLTIGELRASFEEWWVRVYQRRAHSELRDRDLPSRCYTPNQMFAALFDAGAGLPVPIDQTTYIGLMPVVPRTIQNNGIRIDNLTYWHDDLPALRKLTPPTRDGKWAVRKDPYDPDRIWIQHPASGDWLECISESYRRDGYPFASALRLLRNAPEVPGVADEWATEQLTRAADERASRRTSKKTAERSRVVRARRAADAEPRPAPIADAAPVDDSAVADDRAADFALIRTNDRVWND
jgi:putative transposase